MQAWDKIQGHEAVKNVLEHAVVLQRLHHALLFVGPMGVGKRALAHALIRILNCANVPPGTFAPGCGHCPSCRKIEQDIHPDVLLVEPSGKKRKAIKIAQVRALQKAMHLAPYEARERVVLIDDAHCMTEEAANALLKTLEEPAERTRLMLITDQPHLLLDTIISRCQRLRFGALSRAQVVALLSVWNKAQEDPLSEEVLEVAAGYGEGSVGRAWTVCGSGMLSERVALLEQIALLEHKRPRARLDLAEQLGRGNAMLPTQLDMLKVFLRDVLLYQTCVGNERIINRDLIPLVQSFSARKNTQEVLAAIDKVCDAEMLLMRHVSPQMVVEDVLRVLAN